MRTLIDKLKEAIKNHQQKLVLVVGFLLVASLGFELGQRSVPKFSQELISEVEFKEAVTEPANYTPITSGAQTSPAPSAGICTGKIKGSSSMIYHVPGGSFYNRTTKPIQCFDTEAEAKAAGFRKSSR